MKHLTYYLCALALAVPAFAVDGVTLINQSTVMAAGGFPYVISQPGSYRLSGDLVPQSTTAIQITSNNVSLDLNGFWIYCTACSGVPGIYSAGGNTAISNGTISGFGGSLSGGVGIYFSLFGAKVDRVTTYANAVGILAISNLSVTNSVISYNKLGMQTQGSLAVSGSQFDHNSTLAILMNSGTVTGNTFDSNAQFPLPAADTGAISATSASIFNNSFSNTFNGYAIFATTIPSGIIYGQNTFYSNANIAAGLGVISAGNNVCAGSPGTQC